MQDSHRHPHQHPEGRFYDPTIDTVSRGRKATEDPLSWFEERRASGIQALIYLAAVPSITILTGVLILVISHISGGPLCEQGDAAWLCSHRAQLFFSLVPLGVALAGTGGAFWITYRKWSRYGAWRPWIGIIWVLIPFSLGWLTAFGWMFIL